MASRSIQTAALAAIFFSSLPLVAQAASQYHLADNYDASNLAESWDFFDQADPTHGFVQYVNSQVAQSKLMAGKTTTGHMYLGSDGPASSSNSNAGRQSVRVSTKKAYKYHLMIADIVHAPQGSGPGGSCGLWPALWELGGPDTWPAAGEIDVYEGVNAQAANQMTLHTNQGCQVARNPQAFSGNMTTTDCNVSNGANGNAGCAVVAQGPGADSSFGAGFNAIGGGVYAVEVAPTGIKIWHFPRTAVPADINSGAPNPDPSQWGLPTAAFAGSCDIDKHFKNLNVVINTAFCGDWAGKVWNNPQTDGQPSCAQMTGASSCGAYVAANPGAFKDAYWEIKGIRVYTQASAGSKKRAEENNREVDAAASASSFTIQKRMPDLSDYFSKPTGESYEKCMRLTPGFCGGDRHQNTKRTNLLEHSLDSSDFDNKEERVSSSKKSVSSASGDRMATSQKAMVFGTYTATTLALFFW